MELETYALVKRSVKNLLGIDLNHYKDEQMRRRLDTWLVWSGAENWSEYFRRVRAVPEELERLRDYLMINVSAFFRDPDRWADLRERVIPDLLRVRPRLRLWSAGCSAGLEPYSLAMLLDELTPLRRHTLLATDLDRGALDKARARGPFISQEMHQLNGTQLARYFEPGGPPFFIDKSLARRVQFREHNLLADEFEGDFDLMLCRNVAIYFANAAKNRLYQSLHAALRPGGVLLVGSTELIPNAAELGWQSCGLSLYRKV